MIEVTECEIHDWESGKWGVIIGVSRCKKCGKLSAIYDFPYTYFQQTKEQRKTWVGDNDQTN